MSVEPDMAAVVELIGEPTRAAMLGALLGGVALPAGELAACARITPQTASRHLARLVEGAVLEVRAVGRRRYYRIASPRVGAAFGGARRHRATAALTDTARVGADQSDALRSHLLRSSGGDAWRRADAGAARWRHADRT